MLLQDARVCICTDSLYQRIVLNPASEVLVKGYADSQFRSHPAQIFPNHTNRSVLNHPCWFCLNSKLNCISSHKKTNSGTSSRSRVFGVSQPKMTNYSDTYPSFLELRGCSEWKTMWQYLGFGYFRGNFLLWVTNAFFSIVNHHFCYP